jgi:hypothetical protein
LPKKFTRRFRMHPTAMARWYANNGGYKARKERWYYSFCQYCKIAQPRALVAGAMFYLQLRSISCYFPYISTRFMEEACKKKFYPDVENVFPDDMFIKDRGIDFPWSKGRKCYAEYKTVIHYWAALIFCRYPFNGEATVDTAKKFYSTAATFYKFAKCFGVRELQELPLHYHPLFPFVPWADITRLTALRPVFRKMMFTLREEYLAEKKYSEQSRNYSARKRKKP